MNINELEAQMRGQTHANVVKLAQVHFTSDFFKQYEESSLEAATRVSRLGMNVVYHPTELTKCVIHWVSRDLIGDLWGKSMPHLKPFVLPNGRFDLDQALQGGLSDDVMDNLNAGKNFIHDTTYLLHADWLHSLQARKAANPDDSLARFYTIYKLHSVLVSGGNWREATILENTFTSAGKEYFDWVRDYPHLRREDLEEYVSNSYDAPSAQANQLGIKSTAQEQVMREAVNRGQLAFVPDHSNRTVVFNPELAELVKKEEERQRPYYYDQTQLLLGCPAKFVPSSLYSNGNMMQDLLRFRASVYTELYLGTHNRR